MGRMRSWNSSEYESCGLQPYEISHRGGGRESRKEEEEERKRKRSEERKGKKGITAKGIWIKEIGLEQVFIYFRIGLCKQEEGGRVIACGIKNGNKVFFRHAEDSVTFVMTSCYLLFLENC